MDPIEQHPQLSSPKPTHSKSLMYPHPPFYSHSFSYRPWRYRGPRFVWFGLGALAATWYIRSKEDKTLCGARREPASNRHGMGYGSLRESQDSQNAQSNTSSQLFTSEDRKRLKELGGQATDIVSRGRVGINSSLTRAPDV